MTRPVSFRRRLAAAAAALSVVVAAPAALAATDPYRSQQWALDRIGAPAAWEVASGSGQVVAIIDSGVDLQHPDLVDRLFRDADGTVIGRDYVDGDDVPDDRLGHGTMVAGVVAAATDNGVGVASVAHGARIMPVRVLDENGEGFGEDVEAGIRWAVDHGATVVNLSLESEELEVAGQTTTGLSAPVAAVRYAWDNGVVVVAAAGNSGSRFTDYPPTSPIVLVGATDRDDERAGFSDAGRDDLLMAPGVDIVSTWCRAEGSTVCDGQTHGYGIAEGTSFAAPHVAGALAVLRSTGLNHEQAVERLRETARDLGDPGRDPETGYGLIDLAAATAGGAPSPEPTSPTSSPSPSDASSSPGSPSPEPTTTTTSAPSPSDEPGSQTPTSPSPTASSSPTEDPSATPSGDDSTTPAPADDDPVSPAPDPASAADGLPSDGRGILPALAVLLVALSGVLVGREARRVRPWA